MTLKTLATESVDVEPKTGSDDFGTPTFGSAVTYSNVRVEDEGELTRDQDGNEIQTNGVLYVLDTDATGDFTPESRVTLPDGSTETVMKSAHRDNPAGLEHTKVWF